MADFARFPNAHKIRVDAGLSKVVVYEEAGVTASTLNKVEAGNWCRAAKVVSVFRALNTLSDLDLIQQEQLEFVTR